jgi:hypothetical protein
LRRGPGLVWAGPMEGRSFKRRIGTSIGLVVIASLVATLMGPPAGSAFERADCSRPANAAYSNGPHGPDVLYVGDSISNLTRDYYAFVNGGHGWHTTVLATGGATVLQHFCDSWGSWTWARNVAHGAVVAELGTNDISGIDAQHPADPNQRLQEFANIFNATKLATDYVNNRCMVWIGANEVFNTYVFGQKFTDTASAAAFDRYVKGLLSSHPRLHYADYSAFIRGNATYRASLTTAKGHDGIHPVTGAGKRELAAWVARRVDNNCI